MRITTTVFSIPVLLVLVCASCTPGIKRVIVPYENRYIETPGKGAALVRSAACDIYLEHVTPEKWKKILGFRNYSNVNPLLSSCRMPPFDFFQVSIGNTSDQPLVVEELYVRWSGGTVKELRPDELRRRCQGPDYRIYNFDGLYSNLRVIGRSFSIMDIDYQKDTIGLDLPFVPAGESVLFIRAFDWLPAEAREFSVVVTVRAGARRSSVGMTMRTQEFRTRGKDFAEPEKETADIDD